MPDARALINEFVNAAEGAFTDSELVDYLTRHEVTEADARCAVEDWARYMRGDALPEHLGAVLVALGVPADWRRCSVAQMERVAYCAERAAEDAVRLAEREARIVERLAAAGRKHGVEKIGDLPSEEQPLIDKWLMAHTDAMEARAVADAFRMYAPLDEVREALGVTTPLPRHPRRRCRRRR
jgi:hypothetical protein